MEFTDEADFLEWIATTHGVIEAFKHRGYGLYVYGAANITMPMMSLSALDDLITFGPVDDVLDVGIRYIPLPLVAKERQADRRYSVRSSVWL